MRDQSYDFVENKDIIVDEDAEDIKEKMSQDQYYLYQAAKFVTVGVMRFARKI